MSLRDSFKSSKSFRSSKGVTILAKWCNGSTTDSGSVCLGSSPSLATTKIDFQCGSQFSLKFKVYSLKASI